MSAIYKRELRSYFSSMTGYIFIAAMVFVTGINFLAFNLIGGHPYFTYALSGVITVFIFLTPLLTMKSMAEERKLKTDQLLLTAPVKPSAIILGKFFSMLTVFAIPLAIFCVCPLIIALFGENSFISGDFAFIFAVLCFGSMLISIGMFISSLTENQLIAAVVTVIVFFVLNIWDNIISLLPLTAVGSFVGFLVIWAALALIFYAFSKNIVLSSSIGGVGIIIIAALYLADSSLFDGLLVKTMSTLSVMTPLLNIARYMIFDIAGIFFYLSVSALFLFLTVQTLQKRRFS